MTDLPTDAADPGDPTDMDDRLTWTGLPVVCSVCLRAGTPVYLDGGWRLPQHNWDALDYRLCPNSLTKVDAQVDRRMDERVEKAVVKAMPPRINDDWDTP